MTRNNKMTISDPAHNKAVLIEHNVKGDPMVTTDYNATYWLALACSLLTSPIAAEREHGKTLVRRWRGG